MRYAIKGERPGTTIHVGGRFIATDPQDASANLTEAQAKELKNRGYELAPVQKLENVEADAERVIDAEAAVKIAENKAAADEHNATVNRAPRKRAPK